MATASEHALTDPLLTGQLADGHFSNGDAGIEAAQPVFEQEAEPEIEININNVVCVFNTRCHLNLKKIAMEGMHVEHKREQGMVSMKIRHPRTTASIWSSGKITCTGSRSEDEAKIAGRKFARLLQKLGFRTRFCQFRVVNVLGTCSMPFSVDLNAFSRQNPRTASYEPELHPAVTYRLKDPKAVLKIFSTGSITVTAPRVANIQSAIEHIFPLVYVFKRPKRVVPSEVNELRASAVEVKRPHKRSSSRREKNKRRKLIQENSDSNFESTDTETSDSADSDVPTDQSYD